MGFDKGKSYWMWQMDGSGMLTNLAAAQKVFRLTFNRDPKAIVVNPQHGDVLGVQVDSACNAAILYLEI